MPIILTEKKNKGLGYTTHKRTPKLSPRENNIQEMKKFVPFGDPKWKGKKTKKGQKSKKPLSRNGKPANPSNSRPRRFKTTTGKPAYHSGIDDRPGKWGAQKLNFRGKK